MAPLAFAFPFIGRGTSLDHIHRLPVRRRRLRSPNSQPSPVRSLRAQLQAPLESRPKRNENSKRVIGIIGKAKQDKQVSVEVDSNQRQGIFGLKAKAYWDSMGFLPLFFAGFGIVALAIKMVKVKGGEWSSGPDGLNKVTIPKTVITTEEEEAELHVFKCGGCGYEMYPARGRESVFFPDSFKCPLCKTPKSEFWDLNDPTDPRNQVSDDKDEEEEEEEDIVTESNGNGSTSLSPEDQKLENPNAETPAKDLTEPDSSS